MMLYKDTLFSLCHHGIQIYLINRTSDSVPHRHIREKLHDASLIGERGILQHGEILHHAVLYDVFHDLVYEINLAAVETHIIQIFGKCGFCGMHVHTDDLADEFAQRFLSIFRFIILAAAELMPHHVFQRGHIQGIEGLVGFQLGDGRVFLMRVDVMLRLGTVERISSSKCVSYILLSPCWIYFIRPRSASRICSNSLIPASSR